MRINIIGTPPEVDAAVAAVRAALDVTEVSEPISGRDDLVMTSIEAHRRLAWPVVERERAQATDRDTIRRQLAALDNRRRS